MKLLTKELREKIPPLYSTEEISTEDKVAVAKFFTPDAGWTWYVFEGSLRVQEDGELKYLPLSSDYTLDEKFFQENDVIFFGYVIGQFNEWGYFSLNELMGIRGPLGLPIERDMYFRDTKFSEL